MHITGSILLYSLCNVKIIYRFFRRTFAFGNIRQRNCDGKCNGKYERYHGLAVLNLLVRDAQFFPEPHYDGGSDKDSNHIRHRRGREDTGHSREDRQNREKIYTQALHRKLCVKLAVSAEHLNKYQRNHLKQYGTDQAGDGRPFDNQPQ